MNYKIYIVEDQKDQYYSLCAMLKKYSPEFEVVSEYMGTQPYVESIENIRIIQPDLLFVDYDLQEGSKNGLRLCENTMNDNMFAIFFSTNEKEAKKSTFRIIDSKDIKKNGEFIFDGNVCRWDKGSFDIIREDDLKDLIYISKEFLDRRHRIVFKVTNFVNRTEIIIPYHKLKAIKADGRNSYLFSSQNEHPDHCSEGLKDFENKFKVMDVNVVRVHDSWMINAGKIVGYNRSEDTFIIHGLEFPIPIGRAFKKRDDVRQCINRFN